MNQALADFMRLNNLTHADIIAQLQLIQSGVVEPSSSSSALKATEVSVQALIEQHEIELEKLTAADALETTLKHALDEYEARRVDEESLHFEVIDGNTTTTTSRAG